MADQGSLGHSGAEHITRLAPIRRIATSATPVEAFLVRRISSLPNGSAIDASGATGEWVGV